MMKRRSVSVALFFGILVSGGLGLAHSGKNLPKPFVQRHAVMTSLAAHMGAIKTALAAGDRKGIARHADAIHWLARILPDTFPKGSGAAMGKSRAADRIWTDWPGFLKASMALASEAKSLAGQAKGASSGDLRAAFVRMRRMPQALSLAQAVARALSPCSPDIHRAA